MKEKDKYIENSNDDLKNQIDQENNEKQTTYYKSIYENQTFDFSDFIKSLSTKITKNNAQRNKIEKIDKVENKSKIPEKEEENATLNSKEIFYQNTNIDYQQYEEITKKKKLISPSFKEKIRSLINTFERIKSSLFIFCAFLFFTLMILSLVPVKKLERIFELKMNGYGFKMAERKIIRFDPLKMSLRVDNLEIYDVKKNISIKILYLYYNVITKKIKIIGGQTNLQDREFKNFRIKKTLSFFKNASFQIINHQLNIIVNSNNKNNDNIEDALSFLIDGDISIYNNKKNIDIKANADNQDFILKYDFKKGGKNNLTIKSPIINLNYNNNGNKNKIIYDGDISLKYLIDSILKNYSYFLTKNISESWVKFSGLVELEQNGVISIKSDKNNILDYNMKIEKKDKKINFQTDIKSKKITLQKANKNSKTNKTVSKLINNILSQNVINKLNAKFSIEIDNIYFENSKITNKVKLIYDELSPKNNNFLINFINDEIKIEKDNNNINFSIKNDRNFYKIIDSVFLGKKLKLSFNDKENNSNKIFGSIKINDITLKEFDISGNVTLKDSQNSDKKIIIFESKKSLSENTSVFSASLNNIHPKDFINIKTIDNIFLKCIKNQLSPNQQYSLSSIFFCNPDNEKTDINLKFYNFQIDEGSLTKDTSFFVHFIRNKDQISSDLKINNPNNDINIDCSIKKNADTDINTLDISSNAKNYKFSELNHLIKDIFGTNFKLEKNKNYNIMSINNFDGTINLDWINPEKNSTFQIKSNVNNGVVDIDILSIKYDKNKFVLNGSLNLMSKPSILVNIASNSDIGDLLDLFEIKTKNKINGFSEIKGSLSSNGFFSIKDFLNNLSGNLSVKLLDIGLKNLDLKSLSAKLILSKDHKSINVNEILHSDNVMTLNSISGDLDISDGIISTHGLVGKETAISTLFKFNYNPYTRYFNDISADFIILGIKPTNSDFNKNEFLNIPFSIRAKGSLDEDDLAYKEYHERINEYLKNMIEIENKFGKKEW